LQCIEGYQGTHYLGGRFLPEKLKEKYHLILPDFDTDTPTQLYKYPAHNEEIPSPNGLSQEAPRTTLAPQGEWELCLTNEGHPYYYHPMSGESQWAAFSPLAPSHIDEQQQEQQEILSIYLSTASDRSEAQTIARHLVKQRLAACVNIVPKVTSVYEWEGELEEADEVLMVIKVSVNPNYCLLPAACCHVSALHCVCVLSKPTSLF
jgi:uncharacterized protein involved in tolerance to divalent cations